MNYQDNTIALKTDYITLGQLIKYFRLVETGGEEKEFLLNHKISVNGVEENRRGKKLVSGDKVSIDGKIYLVCSSSN